MTTEILEQVLDEEVAAKAGKSITMARCPLPAARCPLRKSLETFDFGDQPSIAAKQVQQLATCHFIENGDNVTVLGPPGVGQMYLAVSLEMKAIEVHDLPWAAEGGIPALV